MSNWPHTQLHVNAEFIHVPANEEWEGSITPIIIRRDGPDAETQQQELETFHYCGTLAEVNTAMLGDLAPIGQQVRQEDEQDESLPIALVDTKDMLKNGKAKVIRRFLTVSAASEHVSGLPDAKDGRYSIDAPEGWED